MFKKRPSTRTVIKRNESFQADRIEVRMQRILNNKEPIKDGAELIYTERKDGIQPAYNPRTDRFEIAVELMDKSAKTNAAKRKANIEKFTKKLDNDNKNDTNEPKPKKDGGAEPTQATDNK